MGFSLSETLSVDALPSLSQNATQLQTSEDGVVYLAPTSDTNKCWPIRPTLRNELDTFSVHFYVFFGPNISVPPDRAAVFAINLMPVLDSGGVLNMELKLNLVSFFFPDNAIFDCIFNCIILSTHISSTEPRHHQVLLYFLGFSSIHLTSGQYVQMLGVCLYIQTPTTLSPFTYFI